MNRIVMFLVASVLLSTSCASDCERLYKKVMGWQGSLSSQLSGLGGGPGGILGGKIGQEDFLSACRKLDPKRAKCMVDAEGLLDALKCL